MFDYWKECMCEAEASRYGRVLCNGLLSFSIKTSKVRREIVRSSLEFRPIRIVIKTMMHCCCYTVYTLSLSFRVTSTSWRLHWYHHILPQNHDDITLANS